MAQNYTLDSGEMVAFGQHQHELEAQHGFKAGEWNTRITRTGIDLKIDLPEVCLGLDTGLLKRIEFKRNYQFIHPLVIYPEPWKNLDPVGEQRIYHGISHAEFLAYLEFWEERAGALGMTKTDLDKLGDGENLSATQYSIFSGCDEYANMVAINMGPSRRAGGGGVWCDGWTAFFMIESDCQTASEKVGALKSISAFRDEFNTVARPPAAT